jgi:hypothetical protein
VWLASWLSHVWFFLAKNAKQCGSLNLVQLAVSATLCFAAGRMMHRYATHHTVQWPVMPRISVLATLSLVAHWPWTTFLSFGLNISI